MPDAHITFCKFGSARGEIVPTLKGPFTTEVKTLSGSNQATTAAAGGEFDVVRVYCPDADFYMAIGATPDATVSGARVRIAAGTPEVFSPRPGEKVAVVQV